MQETTLRQIVSEAKRIVFFGGAGVSKGSGIPDFRERAAFIPRAAQNLPRRY